MAKTVESVRYLSLTGCNRGGERLFPLLCVVSRIRVGEIAGERGDEPVIIGRDTAVLWFHTGAGENVKTFSGRFVP